MYASDYLASERMKFVYAVYYVYASGTVASYKFWLLETFGSLEPNLPGIEARKKKALNGSACRSKLDLTGTGIPFCRRFANFCWTDNWTTDRRRATNHSDKGMCLRVTCKDRSIGWVWKYEQGGVQSSQTTSDVSCYHRNRSGQYKMQTADGEFKLFFVWYVNLTDCHAIAFPPLSFTIICTIVEYSFCIILRFIFVAKLKWDLGSIKA